MRKGDQIFGELAVKLGMMTQEQLTECVTAQLREASGKRLVDICRNKGFLDDADVKFILGHHKQQAQRGWAQAADRDRREKTSEPVRGLPSLEDLAEQESGRKRRFRRTGAVQPLKPPVRGRATEIPIAVDIDLNADDVELNADDVDEAAGEIELNLDDVDGAAPDTPAPAAEPAEAPVRPTVRQQTHSRLALGVIPVVTRQQVRRKLPSEDAAIDVLLRRMVNEEASDLHLSAGCAPLVRLHGSMKPLGGQGRLDQEQLCKMLLEIAPERAQDEFATTNDADFAYALEGVARFRANYFVDRRGMGAVFRQIPMEVMTPEQLGLSEQVLELCRLTKGLVLVTGPTGSGKSTTLASLVDHINRTRDDHIITIEDPIEFVHDNKRCHVNQREVGAHTRSFAVALRAALREDPDIVLVGELRDLETIAIAIETAETGHLVFGTLHTTSAPSTVDRIIEQFPADKQAQIRTMLAGSLRGVIAQVLCRKRSGGRVAAYEILVATPAVANLIREGKSHQLLSVMQTGRGLGMQTMNDHLLQLVREGAVATEEAYLKATDKQGLRSLFEREGIAGGS